MEDKDTKPGQPLKGGVFIGGDNCLGDEPQDSKDSTTNERSDEEEKASKEETVPGR